MLPQVGSASSESLKSSQYYPFNVDIIKRMQTHISVKCYGADIDPVLLLIIKSTNSQKKCSKVNVLEIKYYSIFF